MVRPIDADHLRRWILSRGFKTQLSVADVIDQIDREDTIEPERKKGKWIKEDRGHVEPDAVCSECGFDWMWSDRGYFKYCPNCGARMEGQE